MSDTAGQTQGEQTQRNDMGDNREETEHAEDTDRLPDDQESNKQA
jgi:hypothetical protein